MSVGGKWSARLLRLMLLKRQRLGYHHRRCDRALVGQANVKSPGGLERLQLFQRRDLWHLPPLRKALLMQSVSVKIIDVFGSFVYVFPNLSVRLCAYPQRHMKSWLYAQSRRVVAALRGVALLSLVVRRQRVLPYGVCE